MRSNVFLCLLAASMVSTAHSQRQQPPSADDIGFANGTIKIETPGLKLEFLKDSQTLYSYQTGIFAGKPGDKDLQQMADRIGKETASVSIDKTFLGHEFLPVDRQRLRNANGFYQFGDLNLRVKTASETEYKSYSTATKRTPLKMIRSENGLLTSDLAAAFPADFPLQIQRTWQVKNGHLELSFTIKNPTKEWVSIGALGIPLVVNNIISDRNLKEAHERCVFSDPYIGKDAGYVQVTRLSGQGPALVIAPLKNTPLEAYRLLNEPMRPNQTFEGMFEWMVSSAAYADNEWKNAKQWNQPSSRVLPPGESTTIGLQFLVLPSIRGIEKRLADEGHPVAVGVPGYILPMDQQAKLFLKYKSAVKSFESDPPEALVANAATNVRNGYREVLVSGHTWGRARLTINYADHTSQTVHYYITKPAYIAVGNMGNFLATKQYFTDTNDPFHRAPSFISYDREADKQVTQDSRVWISGLGDEGGSGSFVAMAMKLFGQPTKEQVNKFEDFVDGVLWGNIQFKDGPNKYGVRKSVFFYDPTLVPGFSYDANRNWTSWTSWNKKASEDIGRGYNYPHMVASYWAMYRIARNTTGLATHHDWKWYLNQAFETTKFMTSKNPDGSPRVWYVDLGLMEGTVFVNLLQDLKREGWTEQANLIESRMKARADKWIGEEFPFGSEMAWDSTGQEEVYDWCKYFGRNDKAMVSLNSIIGYMPTLPHWGYNGNARRYWDFLYGGKLSRIERQLHHYGSGLNAIPMLTEYREHPDDFYLLRAGYGGAMGALSNLDQQGCASVAFHSFPSTLKWDAYTGDYGPNFFGHAINAATYLVDHPDFGWVAFGGNVEIAGNEVKLTPLDSFRRQVYIAPAGLWLTLDSGQFDGVTYNRKTKEIKLALAGVNTAVARLIVQQPGSKDGKVTYRFGKAYDMDAGAATIPLEKGYAQVEMKPGK